MEVSYGGGMVGRLARGRPRRAIALCCALLLAVVAPGPAAAAHPAAPEIPTAQQTVPGMPGTPQPATSLFTEDFQNRQSALPIRLTSYTGVTGMTYTADPAWLQNCNGWVAAFQDPAGTNPAVAPQVADCTPAPGGPGTPGVTAWNRVRQLSQALGVLNGSADPAANMAVSAYTNGPVNNGDPGPNKVEFETAGTIPVPQSGRFLTFSVNAAETSCDATHNHARLNFYLVNGETTTPVTSGPIEPCARGTEVSPGFRAGTFTGDAPLLYTGSSAVGIRMTNSQGSGNGNDHAFDDIRLMDVTPQLDKSFEPGSTEVGHVSKMTFTITNTDDLLAKSGWSFTDELPDGLTLASPADAQTDCPAGDIDAEDGGSTISLTDGALNAGQASCTVTVNVTSDTAGTYTNNASNITSSTGLNPPGDSSVTFVPAREASISLEKSASPTSFSAPGQVIRYSYLVTNTGDLPLTDVGVTDDLSGLPDVSCPRTTLDVGESQTCTATYTTTQEDMARGSIHNVATSHGTPPDATEPVVSDPSEVTLNSTAEPGISVRKSASPPSFSAAGQVIHYSYLVTNTGEVPLTGVGVTDDLDGLSAVSCPQTTLDVGESQTCTATYTTTQEDVKRGSIRNVATSHGTPPGAAEPVVSEPSEVTLHATPAGKPGIALKKAVKPDTYSEAGQVLHYSYLVTNTGDGTLTDVRIKDRLRGLSAIECPRTELPPGESETCTATYEIKKADIEAGFVKNCAVAQGTTPSHGSVESSPAKAKAYVRHPVTP